MVRRFGVVERERFFELMGVGLSMSAASAAVGASRGSARRWWEQAGSMTPLRMGRRGGMAEPLPPPREKSGRYLSSEDRAVIQVGLIQRLSLAEIGALIGRDKSVICREIRRNRSPDGVYRARIADRVAASRQARPKPFKLAANEALCRQITTWLDQGWSPRLIADMLRRESGRDQTGRVSHETIYQALYVQARGNLRADLHQQLSLKRRSRVSRSSRVNPKNPYREAFTISQRPAEAADRAVPGHWEGDLILGSGNKSAIGTLVERSTRFVILLHLPDRHTAPEVADAMITQMRHLPDHLRRSVTWDRGSELADYERIQLALDTRLFFCDPYSPWQRGTNENTNRLLRFWFEKGTDLRTHTATDLKKVQDTLNKRPRPTLDYRTPAQALAKFLQAA